MGCKTTVAAILAMSVVSLAYAESPWVGAVQDAVKAAGKAQPVTYVLQSSALKLTVSQTYGFTLTEVATGNVLLTENKVAFTVGSSALSPTSISNVVTTATTLDGDLVLNTANTAHVNFTLVSPDNLQVTLSCTKGTPAAIAERFADVSGERYYGVWENALPNALDNRGVSSGYDGKELTTTKDVFASSARAPFYMTNKNFGIYANTQALGSYAFGVSGYTTIKFNSPALQYTILHGTTPKAILAQHLAVAGPAFLPPDWAFSTIFWRDDNHQLPTGFLGTNAQDLVLDDASKLAGAKIHTGAIWLDRPYGSETRNVDANVAGWGNMDFDATFTDPSGMAKTLNDEGVKLLVWVANKANNQLYADGTALGYLFTGYSLSPGMDLRIPGAYSWYQGEIGVLDDAAAGKGGRISGFKIDRGGEGEMPDAVINTMTTLQQKLLFENMQGRNGSDFFSFSRNLNDQGRRYAAVWSGDPKTTWLGLQTSVKNGLRTGLINFPMWGADTGGYSGSAPSEELFTRWIAFSAYTPMMEIIQGPGRNIFYDFSATAKANTVKYTNLHHDLIPYTRSALASALRDGVPVMRAMVLEFPTDANVADLADEYMFGPNILVAPVITQYAKGRSVYLPALPNGGVWIDYNNPATSYTGGRTITAKAAVGVIPTFVRSGAIVPRGDIVKANNTWDAAWAPALHIDVFPAAAASAFDYYTGSGTSTIGLKALANGYEITTTAALGTAGAFKIALPAAPVGVAFNGVAAGYSYDAVAHVLTVNFAGDQALDLVVTTK